MSAAALDAKEKLERGLASLGLSLRPDSSLCEQFITSGGKGDLVFVLKKMAHMHYLYNYTNGAYQAALDDLVDDLADNASYKGYGDPDSDRFYYPGIGIEAGTFLQTEARFAFPSHLPWRPGITTESALDAALSVADAEAATKKRKRDDLNERRAEALNKRRSSFAAARQRAGAIFVTTVSDLTRYTEPDEIGTFDSLILRSTTTLSAISDLADKIEEACRSKKERLDAFHARMADAKVIKTIKDLSPSMLDDFLSLNATKTVDDLVAAATELDAIRVAVQERTALFWATLEERGVTAFSKLSTIPSSLKGDFFEDKVFPTATLEGVVKSVEEFAKKPVFSGARMCTRPWCKNKHRAVSPIIKESGPVCGACA